MSTSTHRASRRLSVGAGVALAGLLASSIGLTTATVAAGAEPVVPQSEPACTATGNLRTCVFPFTGLWTEGSVAWQSWSVPADIISANIAVEVRGGSGGRGHVGLGGFGAYISGTIDVSAGDQISMIIGGAGGDARPRGTTDTTTDQGQGGYPNGGMAGGNLTMGNGSAPGFGSGGGGGSTIVGITRAAGPGTVFAIAAGGGGGAQGFLTGNGNGGNADAAGTDGTSSGGSTGGLGGGTGNDTEGGAAGLNGYCDVPGVTVGNGSPGSPITNGLFGMGGAGGRGYYSGVGTGGGGGGGLTGGGGGGAGGFCDLASANNASGGGGGGGRSTYDPAVLNNGQIALDGDRGHGEVWISYRIADDTDPETSIVLAPNNPTAETSAQFTVEGGDEGTSASGVVGFECSLDDAPFTACSSPISYSELSQGQHSLQVRAIDAAGHRDHTPATHSWVIDSSSVLGSCLSEGEGTTCTFIYTGTVAYQTWVVPDGVTSAVFQVDGAKGGASGDRPGGQGGRAEGTVAVTPGETLRLYIGSQGRDLAGPPGVAECAGGVPNGGAGGCFRSNEPGAGGGGSTDIRRAPYGVQDRLLVGGGGGGAGALYPGGDGGGATGTNGDGSAGGGSGTQESGGPGGPQSSTCGAAGSGGFGFGGNASGCPDLGEPYGGGGGGGYYGGGGGDSGGGGGGGSGFVVPAARNNSLTPGGAMNADGLVRISYGFPFLPDLTIDDLNMEEGASAATPATFTITLSEPSSEPVTVDYTTVDGTATAGEDYVASSGALTIPAGDTSGTVQVLANGDTTWESDESMTIELSNAMGAQILDSTGVLTIVNDGDEPTFSVSSPSVIEGDSGTAPLAFTLSLSNPASRDLHFTAAITGGTAEAGADYIKPDLSTDIVVPAGEISTDITIDVVGDTTIEPDETLRLELSVAAGSPLARATKTGVGTIMSDDRYAFGGFLAPIEPLPILNGAKAGQAIPVKFSLGSDQGLAIFSNGTPTVRQVACDTKATVDEIETIASGKASLSYDLLTDTYTYPWKTSTSWKGTCRTLVVTFIDGTSYSADFNLR